MIKLIIFLLSVVVSGCGEAFGCMECFNGGSGAGVVLECTESEDCGGMTEGCMESEDCVGMAEESAGGDDCNETVDVIGENAEYVGRKPALNDVAEIAETDEMVITTETEKGVEETDKKEIMETAEITEPTDKNEEKENVGEVMVGDDNEDKNNVGDVISNIGNDENTNDKENQKLSADKKELSDNKKNKKSKEDKSIAKYNPDRVVKLAIKKCKAGGMITTEQDLKKKLKAGKITKEEYDEYYPLGGMEGSYYSVFVNVDLNKATTISGERLKSEEEIASHIAGMMLLETDKLFNITYAGIYKTKENEFYEFRCHR